MKHLLEWLWHGEDLGRRLLLIVAGVANVMIAMEHMPILPDEWFRATAHILVAIATAGASKPGNGADATPTT